MPASQRSQMHVAGSEVARGGSVIRFYKNGFTVNDGDLRKLDDPANKEFVDDIENG